MRKSYWVQTAFSIAAIVFIYLPSLVQTTGAAHADSGESLSWAAIVERLRRPKPPRAGKGELCPIAPSMLGETRVVWNVRPLFIWQGSLSRIEVHPQDTDTVLWRQTLANTNRSALYAGKALQPGQTYDWLVFNSFSRDSNRPTFKVSFRLVESAERMQIEAHLKALKAEMRARGMNAEQIARRQADYFTERGLRSDALQEMMSVEHSSDELRRAIQKIPELCEG
jgi:hypothetical protein